MSVVNLNYDAIDECVIRMNLLESKIDEITKNFESKTSQVFNVPYWNGKSTTPYKKNCESLLINLSNAVDNLKNYKASLYEISLSYSKIDNSIKNNGYNI